ncbi:ABC transporter ATP-binding protein [Mycobacteroides abscessus]|uniref:ABC transporter ATP-binding protein n=1 Tax=Mycobacteroides abscessus TaxID=36809 RepID=UPI00092CC492|nr:ABC transporter ATP-binding protein [Mycobacteroides abscessus]SKT09069.1 lipoprotein-releasing system ATP-binding protein LolD [Mycobacteroides abscessus subsp. abscessus]SHT79306.1 lipoprotein-releasing system ATP-binding protein LolD [Mycobacteroides abscessus subsp. bolletii]SHX08817.1 lipoprotein-releasing system ATP-binding protein LolD [Mycobacteroides abscessus subsp. bolletii]SHX25507.1 lipoprotein-releasing system ATP-binding protein LolD [Mycobacteroides abscessus subsp. bolletii]
MNSTEKSNVSPKPVLQLKGVAHQYGTGAAAVHALRGLDLTVNTGEVVLVVGPSGGGKTTALLVMGLLLTPVSGLVRIGGRDVGELAERERAHIRLERLGFLFQEYNLLNALTSAENVALPLRYAGVSKDKAMSRARGLLVDLGMEHRSDHRPPALSGGEKQRVAAARALVARPGLVLADEPTANLDSATGKRVAAQLADAARSQGAAVVIVTHDLRLTDIADRVLHLEDGVLLEKENQ